MNGKPSRDQLFEIARVANQVTHVIGKYFGAIYNVEEFRGEIFYPAKNLRGLLNTAGFRVADDGALIEPKK